MDAIYWHNSAVNQMMEDKMQNRKIKLNSYKMLKRNLCETYDFASYLLPSDSIYYNYTSRFIAVPVMIYRAVLEVSSHNRLPIPI